MKHVMTALLIGCGVLVGLIIGLGVSSENGGTMFPTPVTPASVVVSPSTTAVSA